MVQSNVTGHLKRYAERLRLPVIWGMFFTALNLSTPVFYPAFHTQA